MRGNYAWFPKWDDDDESFWGRSREKELSQLSLSERKPYCIVCCDLNPQNQPEGPEFCITSSNLQRSTKSGCKFCSLIFRSLEHYLWLDGAEQLTRDIVFDVHMTLGEPVLLAQKYWTPHLQSIMLYTPPGSRPAWDTLGSAREICKSAISNECLTLVNKWMSDCTNLHKDCIRREPSKLPKRVVDVGFDNADMRLLEDEGLDARYAALSHCWGKKDPLKTTRSTLCFRKQNLEWTSLPPTFRDAITLTRELGLRYLWIDSLHIIQDDDGDWEVESSKMSFIYEGGHVVIAASGSPDPDHSFLAPRRTEFANPLELIHQRDDGSDCIVKARPVVELNPYQDPLDRRAWTFQEHRRAVRLLRYSTTELKWDCRTKSSCECDSVHVIGLDRHEIFGKYCVEDSAFSPEGLFSQWQTGLHAYTRRQLTKQSDWLPALSGIAALVHERTGSDYLAGLWKDNIVSDLQWKITHTLRKDGDVRSGKNVFQFPLLRGSPTYRAPTFSWASIDSETEYRTNGVSHDPDLDAALLDSQCTLKGANPFGEVVNGFILLEAFMVQASISIGLPNGEIGSNDAGNYDLTRNGMHTFMYADLPLVEAQVCDQSGEQERTIKRASIGDELKPVTAGSVSCVFLSRKENGGIGALVLGLSPTVPGAYERLGAMDFRDVTLGHGREPLAGDAWFTGAKMHVVKIV